MARRYLKFAGEILTSTNLEQGGCQYTCSAQKVGTAGGGTTIRVFCSKVNKKCAPFDFKKQKKTLAQMTIPEQILYYGGIAPYKGGYLTEEYKKVPVYLRNKKGSPPDEMAQIMGYRSENELYRAIKQAERERVLAEEEEYYGGKE